MKILAVCTANLQRSVTLEAMVNATPGYEARSAGTHPAAPGKPVTDEALRWADRIIVFESAHVRAIKSKHWTLFPELRIVNLDIPDDYFAFDPVLVDHLQRQFFWRFDIWLAAPPPLSCL